MMSTRQSLRFTMVLLAMATMLIANAAQAQKVKVNKATPAEAEQDTTEPLPVLIEGEGFDDDTTITFLVSGTKSEGGINVDQSETVFHNANQLTVKITVEEFAVLGDYDIQARNGRGRRGKGNTLFKVLEKGGGGNTNPYDGEVIALDCLLDDLEDGANLFSDDRGLYEDGERKASCGTGGIAQPNTSGVYLDPHNQGPAKRAQRKMDFAFGGCIEGEDFECSVAPPGFWVSTTNFADMEHGVMGVVPYPGINPHSEYDDIQLLDPGVYEMALRLGAGNEGANNGRFVLQFIDRPIPAEFHQGVWCDLEQNPHFDPEHAVNQSVKVWVGPDDDGDSAADSFVVTTGDFELDSDGNVIRHIPGAKTAALCSDLGSVVCEGPAGGDMCNLLGTVSVQFTWYARKQ